MSELVSALQWLYSTLNGDTTLSGYVTGVYSEVAPADAMYPFVVIVTYTPGLDTSFNNAQRVLTNPLFIVKVIGATASLVALEQATDRVDALLHRQSNSAAGVLSCVREQPFSMAEFDPTENKHYRHLGGFYRLQVQ